MADRPHFHDVWLLHLEGRSVRQIAFALDLADRTVEDQLRSASRYYDRQESAMDPWLSIYPDHQRREWMKARLLRWKRR